MKVHSDDAQGAPPSCASDAALRQRSGSLFGLRDFVAESNRIEGIHRPPHLVEVEAHAEFVTAGVVTPSVLLRLLSVLQPDARLRDRPGLNVRVGNHVPPPGGPEMVRRLDVLLDEMHQPGADPFETHRQYETLHPFTDGNGRTGRALWLWLMLAQGRGGHALGLGFLHSWYYQSLAAEPRP